MLATANTGKTLDRFWKNVDEWTRRVEISKGGSPGSRHSLNIDLLKTLTGQPLSSGFSTTDGI